jgi:hypothetical protein
VNSEGFRETLSEERQRGPKKAKMAGKKEAKQKAGPRGQTEKNREETKSSAGTKNTSEGSGQRAAQRTQQRIPREQEGQRPGEGAQGQKKVEGKDIQEAIKEIDKVLDHLEGRLDKVTAAIRQAAMQGKALELVMPEEGTDRTGPRDSLEELETPALQSSIEEHRIVDIEPRTGAPELGMPQVGGDPPPTALSGATRGRRRVSGLLWRSKEDEPKRNMTSSGV